MSKSNIKDYIKSFNDTLLSMPFISRFPKDDEFKEALLKKDIYTAQSGRICKYMLRKLENYGHKEPIPVDDYTVEHVMPQTLTSAWRMELGENYSEIHEKYLHTIGNLTLTGYNPEYSNSPFKEKRDMEKGFRQSHLYLNENLACVDQWNEDTIRARSAELAEKVCEIWIYPKGDMDLSYNMDDLFEETYNTTSAPQKIRVTMDNGEVIDHHISQDTFDEVIIKLGLEKVMNVHPRTVSTIPFDNGRHRQHGEFYINMNHGAVAKKDILERIADALGVSMGIEVIEK